MNLQQDQRRLRDEEQRKQVAKEAGIRTHFSYAPYLLKINLQLFTMNALSHKYNSEPVVDTFKPTMLLLSNNISYHGNSYLHDNTNNGTYNYWHQRHFLGNGDDNMVDDNQINAPSYGNKPLEHYNQAIIQRLEGVYLDPSIEYNQQIVEYANNIPIKPWMVDNNNTHENQKGILSHLFSREDSASAGTFAIGTTLKQKDENTKKMAALVDNLTKAKMQLSQAKKQQQQNNNFVNVVQTQTQTQIPNNPLEYYQNAVEIAETDIEKFKSKMTMEVAFAQKILQQNKMVEQFVVRNQFLRMLQQSQQINNNHVDTSSPTITASDVRSCFSTDKPPVLLQPHQVSANVKQLNLILRKNVNVTLSHLFTQHHLLKLHGVQYVIKDRKWDTSKLQFARDRPKSMHGGGYTKRKHHHHYHHLSKHTYRMQQQRQMGGYNFDWQALSRWQLQTNSAMIRTIEEGLSNISGILIITVQLYLVEFKYTPENVMNLVMQSSYLAKLYNKKQHANLYCEKRHADVTVAWTELTDLITQAADHTSEKESTEPTKEEVTNALQAMQNKKHNDTNTKAVLTHMLQSVAPSSAKRLTTTKSSVSRPENSDVHNNNEPLLFALPEYHKRNKQEV